MSYNSFIFESYNFNSLDQILYLNYSFDEKEFFTEEIKNDKYIINYDY